MFPGTPHAFERLCGQPVVAKALHVHTIEMVHVSAVLKDQTTPDTYSNVTKDG